MIVQEFCNVLCIAAVPSRFFGRRVPIRAREAAPPCQQIRREKTRSPGAGREGHPRSGRRTKVNAVAVSYAADDSVSRYRCRRHEAFPFYDTRAGR